MVHAALAIVVRRFDAGREFQLHQQIARFSRRPPACRVHRIAPREQDGFEAFRYPEWQTIFCARLSSFSVRVERILAHRVRVAGQTLAPCRVARALRDASRASRWRRSRSRSSQPSACHCVSSSRTRARSQRLRSHRRKLLEVLHELHGLRLFLRALVFAFLARGIEFSEQRVARGAELAPLALIGIAAAVAERSPFFLQLACIAR